MRARLHASFFYLCELNLGGGLGGGVWEKQKKVSEKQEALAVVSHNREMIDLGYTKKIICII